MSGGQELRTSGQCATIHLRQTFTRSQDVQHNLRLQARKAKGNTATPSSSSSSNEQKSCRPLSFACDRSLTFMCNRCTSTCSQPNPHPYCNCPFSMRLVVRASDSPPSPADRRCTLRVHAPPHRQSLDWKISNILGPIRAHPQEELEVCT